MEKYIVENDGTIVAATVADELDCPEVIHNSYADAVETAKWTKFVNAYHNDKR